MPKILLVDNYDSFTYNLLHYLEELSNSMVKVIRNDELSIEEAEKYDCFVISPGPGLPESSGQLLPFLRHFIDKKKILGICLGQQAIAEVFGMQLLNLEEVVHGQSKQINVCIENETLYKGLPNQFKVGRYHSWVIDPKTVSPEFLVTSIDNEQNIMSITHKNLPIKAMQFHPESILTEHGKEIIKNWLEN